MIGFDICDLLEDSQTRYYLCRTNEKEDFLQK